jgi:NAD(P)-dependent dehydrogenase (short-subunit alcohol dehydrogenase family)
MTERHANDPRLVVITGATRGLGRAMTDRFIEEGWTVVGCGSSAERVEQLTQRHAAPHRFDVVDVRDADAVFRWGKSVFQSHAAPDLLLNNAAVINASAPLWDIDVDDFARVVDVNLKGLFHVLRAFIPAMSARRKGVIVNFSSGWGRSTSPDVAPYCATKWGVEGLTQSLAQELPEGVAAVALNPGVIDTDMLRSCWADDAAQFQNPVDWSRRAVPFLLQLSAADNGRSLSAPGA